MSRGHGRVENAIINAFVANPSATFDARELASIAYPGMTIEKKHQTAALRAARKLANRYFIYEGFPIRHGAGGIVYVYAENARSFSIGKLRAQSGGSLSVPRCEAILDDPASEPHALAQPNGRWGLQAKRKQLLADGRYEEAERIQQRIAETREGDGIFTAAVRSSTPDAQGAHP